MKLLVIVNNLGSSRSEDTHLKLKRRDLLLMHLGIRLLRGFIACFCSRKIRTNCVELSGCRNMFSGQHLKLDFSLIAA